MRVRVSCDACAERGETVRFHLERRIIQPETIYVICPVCEGVLEVEITARWLRRAVPV